MQYGGCNGYPKFDFRGFRPLRRVYVAIVCSAFCDPSRWRSKQESVRECFVGERGKHVTERSTLFESLLGLLERRVIPVSLGSASSIYTVVVLPDKRLVAAYGLLWFGRNRKKKPHPYRASAAWLAGSPITAATAKRPIVAAARQSNRSTNGSSRRSKCKIVCGIVASTIIKHNYWPPGRLRPSCPLQRSSRNENDYVIGSLTSDEFPDTSNISISRYVVEREDWSRPDVEFQRR
jgi:hypothetical protein